MVKDSGLPDVPTDDDTTCIEFRAHGQQVSGDKSPFDTSTLFLPPNEFYACFNFTSPWKQPVQGLQFATIVDNAETLHHWLFYQTPLPVTDGSFIMCDGQHPLAGPRHGVGAGQPGPGAAARRRSRACTAHGQLRSRAALQQSHRQTFQRCERRARLRVHQVPPQDGVDHLDGHRAHQRSPARSGSASGKCIPGRINMVPTDPIHIFAAWPHMHKLGTRMSTIINRAGGTQEVLIDKPFNFASQVSYDTPAILSPGRHPAHDLLLRQHHSRCGGVRPEHDAGDVLRLPLRVPGARPRQPHDWTDRDQRGQQLVRGQMKGSGSVTRRTVF